MSFTAAKTVRTAAVCLAAIVGASGAAMAATHAQHIAAQIGLVQAMFEAAGMRRTHEFEIDKLWESQTETYTINLQAGARYAIAGACDKDCHDLDLTLSHSSGTVITKDTTTDALPVLYVTPSYSGVYHIKARMYECSVEPCSYAILAMGR